MKSRGESRKRSGLTSGNDTILNKDISTTEAPSQGEEAEGRSDSLEINT
jgi:hypothetical protein